MSAEYEQFQEGAAVAETTSGDDAPVVRIIPVQEGERVTGHRPEGSEDAPSIWDAEPLREAVEQDRLAHPDGSPTKVVLGGGGENPHFPMNEQVPPGNILGQIERWEYEDGVGPVGYSPLADEEIADRVDLGLLEVSADWLRRLGNYDPERGGHPVEEVVGLPRVTILDRSASRGSEIAPATAEALGYNPDAADTDTAPIEQFAPDVSIHEPSYSGTSEGSAPFADGDWGRPSLDDYGADAPGEVDQYFLASESGFPPDAYGDLMFPVVYDGDLYLSALRAARSRIPQSDGLSDDEESRLMSMVARLAAEEFDVDWEQDAARPAPAVPAALSEQFQEDVDPAETPQPDVGDAVRWQSEAGGEREPDEWRYGVVVDGLQDGPDDSVLVAVYQPTPDYDGWEPRDEQNPIQVDNLIPIGSDGVGSLPPVSQVTGGSEQSAARTLARRLAAAARDLVTVPAPEPATSDSNETQTPSTPTEQAAAPDAVETAAYEALTASGTATTTDDVAPDDQIQTQQTQTDSDSTSMSDENLQEQLSEARSTISTLETDLSDRDETIEELQADLEETEDELDSLQDDHEALEEQYGELQEEVEPFKELLAEILAGDSAVDPEYLAETAELSDLVEQLSAHAEDEDEEKSPMERLKEQMSEGIQARGEGRDETEPSPGEITEEQLAEANDRAYEVMDGNDVKAAHESQLSAREYVKNAYGVDPATVESRSELRERVAQQGGD